MNAHAFAQQYLESLGLALTGLDAGAIGRAIDWLRETRDQDGMIYSCGNGGSSSIAAQMVVDLVKGGSYGKQKRFRMMCLSDSISTITAYANDVSYDSIFVEQLRNFARPGDLLIGISGSGNSPNVLQAVEYANAHDCRTIGLTTGKGGQLAELAQLPLLVPTSHMGHLEDIFFILTHVLCYAFIESD